MADTQTSRWAGLRDSCAAAREMLIVVAILALLVAPSSVRNVLERAGIKSVAGVEFDVTTMAESQAELDHAQTQISLLRDQLTLAQQQLTQLGTSPMIAQNKDYTQVSRALARSRVQAEETADLLDSSRAKQDRVFQQMAPSMMSGRRSAKQEVAETAQHTLVPPEELFNR